MSVQEFHVDISDNEKNAVDWLAAESGLSKSLIKQAMNKGAVWLTSKYGTQRIRRASKILDTGNQLHFYYNTEVLQQQIPAPELVSDEGSYSIWVKPRGVLSQGSKWGDHCTISRWIETNDNKQRPAYIIHRLDRAATGLMVIAHGRKVANMFAGLFARKKIRKTYQALVNGSFSDASDWVKITSTIDDKPAVSLVHLIQYHEIYDRSLLEICIETGRKHQIRKHLSEFGHAILGDRPYGGGSDQDLQLAAVSLGFQCPVTGDEKQYELAQDLRPGL